MTIALGLGILFLSLYAGFAERVYSILFGQIVGISQADVLVTIISSTVTLAILLVLFRPLLFSSFDPEVAEARGIPVRLLAILFLVLIAITVSLAVQVVGALLVFTLLVGPAATDVIEGLQDETPELAFVPGLTVAHGLDGGRDGTGEAQLGETGRGLVGVGEHERLHVGVDEGAAAGEHFVE